ncbi:MAG: flavodoxin domain-containing protein [Pseudomonadota bacterium]
MPKILILNDSVYGNAHKLGETVESALKQQGHDVQVERAPTDDTLRAGNFDALLAITSTTGSGDLPENLTRFWIQCQETFPVITGKPYGVIALGDSSYPEFCGSADKLDELFQELAGTRTSEPCRIDTLEHPEPSEPALEWLQEWLNTLI